MYTRYSLCCSLLLIFLAGCDDRSATQAFRDRSTAPLPKVTAKEEPESQDATNTSEAAEEIEPLIDALVNVSDPGFGYSGYFSGSEFLPYADTGQMATLVLGAAHRARSDELRKIVEKGVVAVPSLLEHLDDDRKIKMQAMSGMMWMEFRDEYDFNRRTRKEAPLGVNRDGFFDQQDHPDSHAVTVGDLCFVALGQIVNRGFSATRYQPSGGLIVSSPTYSETLRKVIIADWSGLTEERHKRLLVEDFTTPDHGGRRNGAYLRLSYYYPDTAEQLVLDVLAESTFDVFAISDLCRDSLYKTQDKDERQRLYDAFIRERGEVYSAAVMDHLFDDLNTLEAHERGAISPPLTDFGTQPRELLIQLFGKPADVKIADRPVVESSSESDRARLIRTLIHDDSTKVGDVVLQCFLESPDDDYFAPACLRCLASRGYGDFLVEQLAQINVADSDVNYLHQEYIKSIIASKEANVRDKLCEIVRTTTNEGYFIAALPAADSLDDGLVLERACGILDGYPDDTDRGLALLEMIRERFPDQAKSVYRTFLATGGTRRAETMCRVLWYGDAMAIELLAPLLDDKRRLTEFSIPLRVCDRAAQAISHTSEDISFDSDGSKAERDKQIEYLKRYCEQKIR